MGKKRAASEVSGDELTTKKSKPSSSAPAAKTDADGNSYWEIADKRRVTVSEFKKQHLISIREYYEQNGEMKPGKKGISLTVAQFSALIDVLPAIEQSLRASGQEVSRPSYDGVETEDQVRQQDEEIPDADDGKADGKKNFEETSEEE